MTDDSDTLILVTSDHSHAMSFNGYAPRGSQITGFGKRGTDDLPISKLTYGNGPGYKPYVNNTRYDATDDPIHDIEYMAMTLAPLDSETHGGDDVLIYAKGPYAHLFTGVHQQSFIPHGLAYAGCIGNGPKHEFCTEDGNKDEDDSSGAQNLFIGSTNVIVLAIVSWLGMLFGN